MHKSEYKLTSDEALLTKYVDGELPAFECLYLRHKKALFLFLRRQCSDEAIIEELVHDAWLAVIKQAELYRPEAKFKTWLYRIAHNRLVDYWRKNGSNSKALIDEISHRVATENANCEDMISQGLELKELFRSLEILSTEQMEVVLLRIEGFSHVEIATITESNQETVKSRLRYAKKHLSLAMETMS